MENLFFGEEGAAHAYGPQKGGRIEEVRFLDDGLRRMATVILADKALNLQCVPGSGAAGGLGGAFATFLDRTFVSGANLVLDANGVRKKDVSFSLIFFGEGKIDLQTLKGNYRWASLVSETHKVFGGSVAIPVDELMRPMTSPSRSILTICRLGN